jgi:hypothetical protein
MNNKMEVQKKLKISSTDYNNIYVDHKGRGYYSFKVMIRIKTGIAYIKSFNTLKRAILELNSAILSNNLEEKYPLISLKDDKILEKEEIRFIQNYKSKKEEI